MVESAREVVLLMRAGVRPQQMRVIDVIGIAFAARAVVLGHVEHIEVVLNSDYRT